MILCTWLDLTAFLLLTSRSCRGMMTVMALFECVYKLTKVVEAFIMYCYKSYIWNVDFKPFTKTFLGAVVSFVSDPICSGALYKCQLVRVKTNLNRNPLTCIHIQRCMCCGWKDTSMRAIRCVSGESSEYASTLTLMNDLSRRCPTHGQLVFTQERDSSLCGGDKERGKTGVRFACASFSVCSCVHTVCIISATHGHPCEWRGGSITRVSGLGSLCEWNGREHGVKHFDLCTTLWGTPLFLMGKSMIRFWFGPENALQEPLEAVIYRQLIIG